MYPAGCLPSLILLGIRSQVPKRAVGQLLLALDRPVEQRDMG